MRVCACVFGLRGRKGATTIPPLSPNLDTRDRPRRRNPLHQCRNRYALSDPVPDGVLPALAERETVVVVRRVVGERPACEHNVLPIYYRAKVAADEGLHRAAGKRESDFFGLNLRPGELTGEPAGRVELGRTKSSRGEVARESVARVAALLLQSPGAKSA